MRKSAIRMPGAMLAITLVSIACAGYAASPAVSAAVSARQAAFKEIGGAFKTVNDEIKSGRPDWNTVRSSARNLETRATAVVRYFPRGSGPQAGVRTRALPAIWTDAATFTRLQTEFAANARALSAAAAAGNATDLAAARTALGGSCKACHDRFRAPE